MSLSSREICGALHLHTTFSDGGVAIEELIEVARDLGLDYIVVTDHMTLAGRDRGYEGRHGNLLCIVGYEHQDTENRNHYLAVGTSSVYHDLRSPQDYIDGIRASGGIGFLAHPGESRHFFDIYPAFPWTDWSVTGYDGIELWNQMSEWVEGLRAWHSYVRIVYPRRFLREVRPEQLKRWDELNRTRFVSAVGGVDAHGYRFRLGPFTIRIFPTKVELKGIRTHLYVEAGWGDRSADESKTSLLSALRDGRGFISNYRRGEARGTLLELVDSTGTRFLPGRNDQHPVLPCNLQVSVPRTGLVRLIRNGTAVAEERCRRTSFPIGKPGLYRVEVYRGKNAWIYSNPFPVGAHVK